MRYLIHTGPGIGDIIQFLSMARAIKEQYPNSIVDLLMRGSPQTYNLDNQILECQDFVDNLYWYSSKQIKHDVSLIFKLRKNHYDYGIVRIGASTGKKSLWIYKIMRFVACEKIVGYGTDKVDIKVEIPARTHYLKRNAMLLEAIGIRGRCNALSINKSKLDNEWLISLHIPNDVKVIGLSLGTNPMRWKAKGVDITYDVKSWPLERWVAVANELIAEGYFVVMIGGPKEREEIKQKDLNFPNDKHLIDLVGSTTIKQSLTIINRCSLIVGSEGGMLHCASALGVKTLTIFGGSDYKMWNPGGDYSPMISKDYDCSPCFFTSKAAYCDYHKCLLDISVNDVIKKISCILGDLDS